jgi:hypothetical protein
MRDIPIIRIDCFKLASGNPTRIFSCGFIIAGFILLLLFCVDSRQIIQNLKEEVVIIGYGETT